MPSSTLRRDVAVNGGTAVVHAVRTTSTVPLVAAVDVGGKQLLGGVAAEAQQRVANG